MIDLNYERRKQEWNQELDRRQYNAQKQALNTQSFLNQQIQHKNISNSTTRNTELTVDRQKADKDYAQMLIDQRNSKMAQLKKNRDNNAKLQEQIEYQRIEAMKDGSDREK